MRIRLELEIELPPEGETTCDLRLSMKRPLRRVIGEVFAPRHKIARLMNGAFKILRRKNNIPYLKVKRDAFYSSKKTRRRN